MLDAWEHAMLAQLDADVKRALHTRLGPEVPTPMQCPECANLIAYWTRDFRPAVEEWLDLRFPRSQRTQRANTLRALLLDLRRHIIAAPRITNPIVDRLNRLGSDCIRAVQTRWAVQAGALPLPDRSPSPPPAMAVAPSISIPSRSHAPYLRGRIPHL